MLHFISFGSGSSGNCSLLFDEHNGLMIDAGVGVRTLKKHFKEYGLNLSQVQNILVTHDHADHVKSVGSLSSDYGLPVYAVHKVHTGIDHNWCVRRKIGPERVKVIEKNVPFQIGPFSITPFGVPHDSSDNVGYRIRYTQPTADGTHDIRQTTFVMMTDIGHLTNEMKNNISEANYLVIEADYEKEMLDTGPYPEHLKTRIRGPLGHMSNEECAMALVENATPQLHHVWLCHLSDENNHPDLAEKTVKSILKEHGIIAGNSPGADFCLDVLRRKTPTGIFDLDV